MNTYKKVIDCIRFLLRIAVLRLSGYNVVSQGRLTGKSSIGKRVKFELADKSSVLIIGNHCKIGDNVTFTIGKNSTIEIGDNCIISDNCILRAINSGCIRFQKDSFMNVYGIVLSHQLIQIGENCAIGPRVTICDHDHIVCRDDRQNWFGFRTGRICVERDTWIAANVTILRDSHIEHNSVIGAGTVVKGEILANSIAYNKRNNLIRDLK